MKTLISKANSRKQPSHGQPSQEGGGGGGGVKNDHPPIYFQKIVYKKLLNSKIGGIQPFVNNVKKNSKTYLKNTQTTQNPKNWTAP